MIATRRPGRKTNVTPSAAWRNYRRALRVWRFHVERRQP